MADIRHQKLARVLIHYSLRVQPGDRLALRSSASAAPLVREVYREAIRAGAHVTPFIRLPGLHEIFLREGSDEQLTYISDLDRLEVDYFNVELTIWSEENTRSLNGVDPARTALHSQALAALFKRELEMMASGERRWCGTLFPTNAYAQDAGMSLSEFEDFVYRAGMLDEADPAAAWRKVDVEQQRIADFLQQHDEIHIVAPGTDITYVSVGANGSVARERRISPMAKSSAGQSRIRFAVLCVSATPPSTMATRLRMCD
jgi:aminopeptidase